MLLVSVVLILISTRSIRGAVSCPYVSLASDSWRKQMLNYEQGSRKLFAKGELGHPVAKQMNYLVWNCETEYNLKKIQEQLPRFSTNVTYRNFGVNFANGTAFDGNFDTMHYIQFGWVSSGDNVPASNIYDGTSDTRYFANMAKWNASEMACTFGMYNDGQLLWLICAYNVKGAVLGEIIYEISKDGQYLCADGSQCGTGGTCVESLCRVPVSSPDTLLPIYKPTLMCTSLPYMSQFSRYYALNLHNYYRRLVASGWAENKLTRFTPRAAKMEALSYDCSLEKPANENVMTCQRQLAGFNTITADTGSNVQIIEDINISKEAALERAINEWFSQLHQYGVDPNAVWTENATVRNCANIMHDRYTAVGCAVNNCSANGFTIVECRYGPKNIQQGSPVYESGVPCSKCGEKQKCVFGALCQQ